MFIKDLQRRGVCVCMTHCVMTGWEWGETEQISSDAKDTDNEDRPLSWPAEDRCRGITEAPIFATHQEHITYRCVWSPQTLMHDRVFQISTYRCLQVYGSFSHLLFLQKDSKANSGIVVRWIQWIMTCNGFASVSSCG